LESPIPEAVKALGHGSLGDGSSHFREIFAISRIALRQECSWDPDLLYPYVTAVLFFGYYNCLM